MARSEDVLRRVHRAYEAAHVLAALRALMVACVLVVLAIGLHRTSRVTWLVAGTLAVSLGVLAWRGGAWRRGAFAGVIAGLPPLIVPSMVFALTTGAQCATCEITAPWPCLFACFGTGSLVGIVVGYRAIMDASPRSFAVGAVSTAALTGLLGCGTTGLGGAVGVVVGLVAGTVTGWIVAGRTSTSSA